MQGGIDEHQEYPIADPPRLEPQLQKTAMTRRHLSDVPRRLPLGRIRHEEVRMESPAEPRLARYLVLGEGPYCSAPSESGVSVEPVSKAFNRVVNEHGRDHDSGDDKCWRQAGSFTKQQC